MIKKFMVAAHFVTGSCDPFITTNVSNLDHELSCALNEHLKQSWEG